MVYVPITAAQTDAESPIDDFLMDTIRGDFSDHESRLLLLKAYPLEWRVNDYLKFVPTYKGAYKRVDGSRMVQAQTFTKCNIQLDQPGTTGALTIDVRKYTRRDDSILSMAPKYLNSISGISQIAPALATQAIARSTAQISTQSITVWKTALNVQSIIGLGNNLWRYNLNTAPDADWLTTDTVTFAGCTSGGNNGSFTPVRYGDDGGNNIIVTNASGVAQVGAAGTATLRAYSYNFTNPVNAMFAAGEVATMASHSNALSDGAKTIYAINSGGNNIIVKDATGVAQAGVAGNANCNRWTYTYSVTPSTTDFVVGENAKFASHTSSANDGNLPIRAVNSSGNNIIVYNASGVAQGSPAGTANTNRWIFSLGATPTGISVGHNIFTYSTTSGNNSNTFAAKEVQRSGGDNVVVYNESGVVQAGAAGSLSHSHLVITLSAAPSTKYIVGSSIEMAGTPSISTNVFYTVLEVGYLSGNNVVVTSTASGNTQSSPAGRILTESRSIFATPPTITFLANTYNNRVLQIETTTAVFNSEATVSAAEVTNNVSIGVDITSMPNGDPKGLVVQLQ